MSNLGLLQDLLRKTALDGIVVPSSDEYLSEFTQPFAQRLTWLTRFGGSTGTAIVLRDSAALFLDSRYFLQGQRDTAGLGIDVLPPEETDEWLFRSLTAGQRLGIDTRLQAYHDVERLRLLAAAHGFEIVELDENPIDELWRDGRPPAQRSEIVDYPLEFAGLPAEQKCAELRSALVESGLDLSVVADPEDVAWLLNVRTHDSLITTPAGWHVVPIPLSRVIVEADGPVTWFVERDRLSPGLAQRLDGTVEISDPATFEATLRDRAAGRLVGAPLFRTPHRFAAIAARVGTLRDDPTVPHRRWIKHPAEIEGARRGHDIDALAVIRFLAWLQRTVPGSGLTELDAAAKLTELRAEAPEYLGISMPVMSASGPSGSMPHYVPSADSNRALDEHPIYWMDSGGQYYGCSTDNTVTFALGDPEPRHVRMHTLVLKGFIALSTARFPDGTLSTQLDSFARQYLWDEGFDYGHGTGHGVGNFLNIHEGPIIRKEITHPRVAPLHAGLIMSNEPGYYADDDFGIRIESHMAVVPSEHPGFLEFETISPLPIDPRLVDGDLLSAGERRWLAEYHDAIVTRYAGRLDEETDSWIRNISGAFALIAGE